MARRRKQPTLPPVDEIEAGYAENSPVRSPRIQGLTMMAREWNGLRTQATKTDNHHSQQRILKNKINKYIINQYILQGYCLLGYSLSLPELAIYLQEPMNKVLREGFKGQSAQFGSFSNDKGALEEMAGLTRDLSGMALNFLLQDRATLSKQANVLLEAQGGDYKAFVSAETNRALKNLADQPKMLLDLIKTLAGTNQQAITINNQVNANQTETTHNFITTETAAEMIAEKSMASDVTDRNRVLTEYYTNQEALPNIDPLSQGTETTDKTGRSVSEYRNMQIEVDNHLAKREKDGHIEILPTDPND